MADKKITPRKRATFRIMPMTLSMLGLLFILKVNDVYLNSRELNELLSVRDAVASSKSEEVAKEPEHGEEAKKEDAGHGEAKEEGGHGESETKPPVEETTFGTGKTTVKEIEALKAKQGQTPYTQTEIDLLQNLTKRREELDAREAELALKSKVLDATEKRINDKVSEMKVLQAELSKIVEAYKTQQDNELMSLVKIYENMKPASASAIFNEMDMPILLSVIDKMSERKVAPVLAGMDPKRARDVTEELAALRRSRAAAANAATEATQP